MVIPPAPIICSQIPAASGNVGQYRPPYGRRKCVVVDSFFTEVFYRPYVEKTHRSHQSFSKILGYWALIEGRAPGDS